MTADQRQQGLSFTPRKPLAQLNQERLEAEWEAHIKAEAEAEGDDPEQAWQEELAAQGRIIPLRGRKERVAKA